jgi:hypothetical protein
MFCVPLTCSASKKLQGARPLDTFQHAHFKSNTDIADMDKDGHDHALARLRGEGLSMQQLARLTGISCGIMLVAGKQPRT